MPRFDVVSNLGIDLSCVTHFRYMLKIGKIKNQRWFLAVSAILFTVDFPCLQIIGDIFKSDPNRYYLIVTEAA